jgi:hypothetical protein
MLIMIITYYYSKLSKSKSNSGSNKKASLERNNELSKKANASAETESKKMSCPYSIMEFYAEREYSNREYHIRGTELCRYCRYDSPQ